MMEVESSAVQTVVAVMFDNGDGSCSIQWFKNAAIADALMDEDSPFWDEATWPNEGTYAEELTFPAFLRLENCGFRFSDDRYPDVNEGKSKLADE